MKTNFHLVKAVFFVLFITLLSTKAYSQEPVPQTVPDAIANVPKEVTPLPVAKFLKKKFHLGEILFAEIGKYDNSKMIIMNPEGIKLLDGVATVVVKLDDGRSIGLCDYVLEDSQGKRYPSVALKIDDGVFDGSAWEIIKEGEHRYSLLFFVNCPPDNSNQSYKLKYVLIDKVKDEHDLEFINIGDGDFTKASAIDETVEMPVPPSNTTPAPVPGTVTPPPENNPTPAAPAPVVPPPTTPASPAAPGPTTPAPVPPPAVGK